MAALRFTRALTGFSGPIISLALHFLVTLCYINRWDKATAVTVFPLWSWALVGFVILAIAWPFNRNRFSLLVASVWAMTALVGADEIPGIVNTIKGKKLTAEHPQSHREKPVLRVATINCKNRRVEALLETKPYSPDVVFVQESPSNAQLKQLAKQIHGADGTAAGGFNCGIIAAGELKTLKNSRSPRYTHATLTRPDGSQVDLVSIHLNHAITRWDLWHKDCWKTHYQNRKTRREELITILAEVSQNHGGRSVIFGGDFNAPASDAVFNLLRHNFVDSYRAVGSGWGNTFFNRLPVLRIDQLWATFDVQAVNARAFATRNSDHRLLVCDYILN